jgi:biotin-[acetyl-CoA-carboxylase] ligase BirA-like protein
MMSYTLLSFDEIKSTSDLLKEHFSSFSHFTIIKTNYQYKGRGQYERTWTSNRNENILFSLLLKDLHIKHIDDLKQWMIESIIGFLKSHQLNPVFKKPNDIYINNQKICGILFETRTLNETLEYVIIGVGLNVNQENFQALNATSMKKILKQTFNIQTLFDELLNMMITTYKIK